MLISRGRTCIGEMPRLALASRLFAPHLGNVGLAHRHCNSNSLNPQLLVVQPEQHDGGLDCCRLDQVEHSIFFPPIRSDRRLR
jgi:hypothetical protein